MKKSFKKFGVIVLALAMVFALTATAWAVDSTAAKNEDNGIESEENTLNIVKGIVFVNDESTTVREPNIVYTYTISSVDPGNATVTDKDEVVGKVKAGVLAAVEGSTDATTSTITFADTNTFGATAEGAQHTKNAAFTFTPANFKVSDVLTPGIYRYKIVETTNVTKASVGIEEKATYSAEKFLDVYVHWTDADHTALGIYGYVLFEGDNNQSFNGKTNENIDKKSSGFVDTDPEAGLDHLANVDVYTTQNLYINKSTVGALADKNHNFPIAVTLTAPNGVSNVKLDVTLSGGGTLTTATDTVGTHVASWDVVNGTVKNGSQIAIKGIPTGATVSIVETNNTVDSYKVKAGTSANGVDLLAEAIVDPNATAAATTAHTISAKSEIYFTNTLEDISVTGVTLRVAPFAAMGAAGIVFLAVSKKSKKEEEEA